jgi:hypothetical protein
MSEENTHNRTEQPDIEYEIPLAVTVDPRIELLSVVQILFDYRGFGGHPIMTKLEFSYRDDAMEYFSPFRNHGAVKLFSEMSQKGFWYGTPLRTMLYHSEPPELQKNNLPFDEMVLKMAGGEENLGPFIDQLRKFCLESKFMEFYHSHQATYEKYIRDYRNKMTRDYVQDIEQYFGFRQNSYHIILAPLYGPGGFGPRLEIRKGFYDVYNIVGPRKLVDNNIDFGAEQDMTRTAWHEFSHSFVNDIVKSHMKELLEPCSVLQASKKDQIEATGFLWQDYIWEWVNEHVVRGVATRLAYLHFGMDAGDKRLKKEIDNGFSFVGELCASLEKYESNRDKYPTFKDYFPEIIKVFEDLAE